MITSIARQRRFGGFWLGRPPSLTQFFQYAVTKMFMKPPGGKLMRHATLTGAVKPRVENPKLVVDAMIKQSVFMLIELLDSRPVEPTLLRHARVGQAEAVHRNREGIFVAVHDMICENRVSIQVLGQAQSLPLLP